MDKVSNDSNNNTIVKFIIEITIIIVIIMIVMIIIVRIMIIKIIIVRIIIVRIIIVRIKIFSSSKCRLPLAHITHGYIHNNK